MATIAQLQKESNAAPKFVLFTNQFGFDMFIAADFENEVVVANTDEAMQFSVGFDDEALKLKAYSKLTDYSLQVKQL